jgi:hypothetical protein
MLFQFGGSCHHQTGVDICRTCRWLVANLICFKQAGSMFAGSMTHQIETASRKIPHFTIKAETDIILMGNAVSRYTTDPGGQTND